MVESVNRLLNAVLETDDSVDLTGLAPVLGADQQVGDSELLELLCAQGIPEETVYRAWATSLGMDFTALLDSDIDPRALHRLSPELAERYGAVVIGEEDGMLLVALEDPFDILAVDEIQEETVAPVQVLIAPPTAIRRTLKRLRRGRQGIEGLIARSDSGGDALASFVDTQSLRAHVGSDAVVQVVDYLIDEAVRAGASDVHIEPLRDSLRVRNRVDGVLSTTQTLPPKLGPSITSRIKVLADLDITDTRRPQDGRFQPEEREGIELRVSTLPTVFGEKVVLRVLDRRGARFRLDDLSFDSTALGGLRNALRGSEGLVLVTGPTGSGKTTTLYAALGELDREARNIVTVEDPVEYDLPGAIQVQVDPRSGRDFASSLRSILRQDPDVVMVGEIRDVETARIAIQASLTGHLVFSTLHTNDAASTVHRLLDMGIEPWLVGPALRGVVAQRLLPAICKSCSVPDPDAERLARTLNLPSQLMAAADFRIGEGCDRCDGRGFRGRMPIQEVLTVDRRLQRVIAREGANAVFEPSRSLRTDGYEKAGRGLVRLTDVLATSQDEPNRGPQPPAE